MSKGLKIAVTSTSGSGHYLLKRQRSGALALYNRRLHETMHPVLGPWEEANRLYIEGTGLRGLLTSPPAPRREEPGIVIFDVGLGGAANALAAVACHEGLKGVGGGPRQLRIISFENDLAPLGFALDNAHRLDYLHGREALLESLLDRGEAAQPGINWELRLGDFTEAILQEPLRADAIFFDPFSPRTNPLMWSLPTLEALSRCRRPGGVTRLATYSTAFGTRAALLLAGFYVGEQRGGEIESRARDDSRQGDKERGGKHRGDKYREDKQRGDKHRGDKYCGGGTLATTYFSDLQAPLTRQWLHRWKRNRQPWPPLTQPGDYRGFRELLLQHPQWNHFPEEPAKPAPGKSRAGKKPSGSAPPGKESAKPKGGRPKEGRTRRRRRN